ncbi:hypothetical protein V6L77_01070 [Pannonibacter sp. Pt2-lr]
MSGREKNADEPCPFPPPGEGPAHRTAREIEAEARAWFVDLLQTPTARKRAEFEAWRQAGQRPCRGLPHHRAGLGSGRSAGAAAGRGRRRGAGALSAGDGCPQGAAPHNPPPDGAGAGPAGGSGRGHLAGAAGAFEDMRADYVSPRGSRTTITLSDGSSVLLDAGSALAEDFTPGEGMCACCAARPFSMWSGRNPPLYRGRSRRQRITVLGTRFDVRLQEGGAPSRWIMAAFPSPPKALRPC